MVYISLTICTLCFALPLGCLTGAQELNTPVNEDCLVAFSNGTTGINFTVDCGKDTQMNHDHLVHENTLENIYLSSFHGNPSRFLTHGISRGNTSIFVVFLPLSNTQGILELSYNTTTRWWQNDLTLFTSQIACSVVSTHKFKETFITACVDNDALVMYELELETLNLSTSSVSKLLSISLSGRDFSNLVYRGGRNNERFFVVIGKIIYSIDPTNELMKSLPSHLPADLCHRLYYAGNWRLLAICPGGFSVYYNLNDEQVENTTNSTGLIEYPCPKLDISFTFNINTRKLQYRDWKSESRKEFQLQGNISTAVCSISISSSLFIYTNTEQKVYVLNVTQTPSKSMLLQTSACSREDCKPILVLNKYILIQQSTGSGSQIYTHVQDAEQNYSVRFQEYNRIVGCTLLKYQRGDEEMTMKTTDDIDIIVGVVIPTVVVVLLIIIAVYFATWYRNQRREYSPRGKEQQQGGNITEEELPTEKYPEPETTPSCSEKSGIHIAQSQLKTSLTLCSSEPPCQTPTTTQPDPPFAIDAKAPHSSSPTIVFSSAPGLQLSQSGATASLYSINTRLEYETRVPPIHRPDPDGSESQHHPIS